MCSTVSSIVNSTIQSVPAVFNCATTIASRVGSAALGVIRSPVASAQYAAGKVFNAAVGAFAMAYSVGGFAIPYIKGFGPTVIANAAWAVITIGVGTALLAGRHILDLNLIVAGTTTMGATAIAVATAVSVAATGAAIFFGLGALEVSNDAITRDWIWIAALPVFGVAYWAAVPVTTVIFSTALGALGLFVKANTVGLIPSKSEINAINRNIERAQARAREMASANRVGGEDSDSDDDGDSSHTRRTEYGSHTRSYGLSQESRGVHVSSSSQTHGGGGGGGYASSSQTYGSGSYDPSSSQTRAYGKSSTPTGY